MRRVVRRKSVVAIRSDSMAGEVEEGGSIQCNSILPDSTRVERSRRHLVLLHHCAPPSTLPTRRTDARRFPLAPRY